MQVEEYGQEQTVVVVHKPRLEHIVGHANGQQLLTTVPSKWLDWEDHKNSKRSLNAKLNCWTLFEESSRIVFARP